MARMRDNKKVIYCNSKKLKCFQRNDLDEYDFLLLCRVVMVDICKSLAKLRERREAK